MAPRFVFGRVAALLVTVARAVKAKKPFSPLFVRLGSIEACRLGAKEFVVRL
jgi:hypothetical protein